MLTLHCSRSSQLPVLARAKLPAKGCAGLPAPSSRLPEDPWDWGKEDVLNFLNALDPAHEADRREVQYQLMVLAQAMEEQCECGPYRSLKAVMQEPNPRKLPIQLYAYRDLFEDMWNWLS